jgi:hypothetical protein
MIAVKKSDFPACCLWADMADFKAGNPLFRMP